MIPSGTWRPRSRTSRRPSVTRPPTPRSTPPSQQARADVGKHPLVIDGQRRPGGAGSFDVQNPARHLDRLGTFAEASADDVADAVRARPGLRARLAADARRGARAHPARRRRGDPRARHVPVGAVVALEVGKNRLEAVGDVEEAADLIRYYVRPVRGARRSSSSAWAGCRPASRTRSVLRPVRRVRRDLALQLPDARSPPGRSARRSSPATPSSSSRPQTTPCVGRAAGRDACTRPACPPARFTSSPAGPRSARRSSRTPGVDGIVFTGSYEVGHGDLPRTFATGGRSRGRSSPRWAARTRPSSRPPPTSTRRPRASPARRSARAGRSARPARACYVEASRARRARSSCWPSEAGAVDGGRPRAADCCLGPVINDEAVRAVRARPSRRRAATAES